MGKRPPPGRASVQRCSLSVRPPFEFALAITGHGWFDLEPHHWCAETQTLDTVVRTAGGAADLRLRVAKSGLSLRIDSHRKLDRTGISACRRAVRRMLRLDQDLDEFWQRCGAVPRLAWVSRRGAGRIMRSVSVFEDLMKLLCTTNCSWAATANMVRRLTGALGEPAPSGRRAFPTASACAAHDESFYREQVRAGYRASSCRRLAAAFASGDLTDEHFDDPAVPTDELRDRLLALPGFGPYAAGQALRLLGRYDDLALDSWCRAKLATMQRRKTPPADRSVERRYRTFGEYKGLALWMDLTADWHDE